MVATRPFPSDTAPWKASTLSKANGAPVSTITCGPGTPLTSAWTQKTLAAVEAGKCSPAFPTQTSGTGWEEPPQLAATPKSTLAPTTRALEIILSPQPQYEPRVQRGIRNGMGSGSGRNGNRGARVFAQRKARKSPEAHGTQA